jgi:phage gp45-like
LVFVDADDSLQVLIVSGDGKLSVKLDQVGKKIVVTSGGDIELTCDGDLKLSAKGKVEVKGASISHEAQSEWAAKGATAKLEGTGLVQVTGKPIKLN